MYTKSVDSQEDGAGMDYYTTIDYYTTLDEYSCIEEEYDDIVKKVCFHSHK